jgi:hypothetical protein
LKGTKGSLAKELPKEVLPSESEISTRLLRDAPEIDEELLEALENAEEFEGDLADNFVEIANGGWDEEFEEEEGSYYSEEGEEWEEGEYEEGGEYGNETIRPRTDERELLDQRFEAVGVASVPECDVLRRQ